MSEEIIPPISPRTRRRGAREALLVVGVAAVILLLTQGPSIRKTGERMDPGVIRTAVLAVGEPAGWLGDRLPFADGAHALTAWLSPDDDLEDGPGGFAQTANETAGVPPVTSEAFAPGDIGAEPAPKRELGTLLVTGDSMTQPLDAVLARRLAETGEVVRDPHIGSGISKSTIVDWGRLSVRQAEREPDAVVMYIGANDGFEIDGVACCGPEWAASYATRARTMMDTYRRDGDAVVYWLTLPLPRDEDLARVVRAVNGAFRAAAAPYRRDVRLIDTTALFTPAGFRDELVVDGEEQLVRDADGVHLNETGAELAADLVLRALAQDFEAVPAS